MNTEQFDGHTPGPWTTNDIEGREIWKCLFNGECFTDPSTYGRPGYEEVLIATMAPLPPEDDPLAEAAFERMMADKELMAAAPDLLAAYKRLLKCTIDARYVLMKHYGWMSMNDCTSTEDDEEIVAVVRAIEEALYGEASFEGEEE